MPRESGKILIDLQVPDKGKCYLKIIYIAKKSKQVLGFDEILLKNVDGRNQEVLDYLKNEHVEGRFQISEDDGVRFFLKEEFEHVSYYGVGPYESYSDKRKSSSHGKYEAKVSELHEDYLRPQENGSHIDCDYPKK